MCKEIRQTKIIFTIGPATSDEGVLTRLIEGGVDVCRFNMAHANHEWFRSTIALVNECCRNVGRRIALMMDVKGPEIRTRDVAQPIDLCHDDLITFSYEPFLMPLDEDPEQTILNAFEYLKRREWAVVGDQMIVITNVLGKGKKIIDSLQVRAIE